MREFNPSRSGDTTVKLPAAFITAFDSLRWQGWHISVVDNYPLREGFFAVLRRGEETLILTSEGETREVPA